MTTKTAFCDPLDKKTYSFCLVTLLMFVYSYSTTAMDDAITIKTHSFIYPKNKLHQAPLLIATPIPIGDLKLLAALTCHGNKHTISTLLPEIISRPYYFWAKSLPQNQLVTIHIRNQSTPRSTFP